MTLDPTVPSHLIQGHQAEFDPRASRIPLTGLPAVRTEIWMGGAHALLGEPVRVSDLRAAWLVDCAGELPRPFMGAAARGLSRVFADMEVAPANLSRIHDLVDEIHDAIYGAAPPERVYVLCQQGLNRSGLVSGLLLRALGIAPDAAIQAVRDARPGALSNTTFVRLLHA